MRAARADRSLLRSTDTVDPSVPPELAGAILAALREIRDELRGLRADMRRQATTAPELVAVLADYFGEGRFTVAGLLDVAETEPHGPIAEALGALIDLGARPRSRATAVGRLLARLPELETVAQQRGVAVYRLRT